jgi:hypothetical protein
VIGLFAEDVAAESRRTTKTRKAGCRARARSVTSAGTTNPDNAATVRLPAVDWPSAGDNGKQMFRVKGITSSANSAPDAVPGSRRGRGERTLPVVRGALFPVGLWLDDRGIMGQYRRHSEPALSYRAGLETCTTSFPKFSLRNSIPRAPGAWSIPCRICSR